MNPSPRRSLVPFAALFVLSGACGLIYEVVWSRELVQVFGVTAFAVSTVLASFMGGMALGAALLGRRAERARRPLRLFGLLEAGIGAYALVLPLLLRGVDALYTGIFPLLPDAFLLRTAVRLAFCLFLLGIPTVLMGGTLPALGQGLLRDRRRLGGGVGVLYFVNTLGAAIGCFLAGFWLIPALGLSRTTWLAAALNGAVALTAFLLDRRQPEVQEAVSPPEAEAAPPASSPLWPLAVAFGSGATALLFEVVWFRVLVLVFGSTVYSFSAMLSTFLLGLAVGAAVFGPLADRVRHPGWLLAVTQGLVGLSALAGSLLVERMPGLFLALLARDGFDLGALNRTKLVLCVATLLPPALAFGGTFPIVVRLADRAGGGAGSRIGRAYAWNTLGAILGSLAGGFLLLPLLGAQRTLGTVVALSLCLAFGSLLAAARPARLRWVLPGLGVLALAGVVLVRAPRWDPRILGSGAYRDPQRFLVEGKVALASRVSDRTILSYEEGYNDTIITYRDLKGTYLMVGGSTTASTHFEDMVGQRLLGHIPMVVHPGVPRSVCVVGMGAGITAGAIATHAPERLVLLEIEPGIATAARAFARENEGVLDRPGVQLVVDDAQSWLKLTRERFDVIAATPNFPSLTGSGALYTKEFFGLCRERLAPGGVMVQFAPTWRLMTEDLRTIVGSFLDVYPHVRLFTAGATAVLLGREEPFPPIDEETVFRRVQRPQVAHSLAEVGVRGPVELLSFFQMDEPELAVFAGAAPRNTVDRPSVEFYAPRGVFADTVGANLAAMRQVRPAEDVRLARLALPEPLVSSWRALAAAGDAVAGSIMLLEEGRVDEALEMATPVAASGQRFARYFVATYAGQLGAALLARDPQAAYARFRQAAWAEPERFDAQLGLGEAAMLCGRLDEADRVLTAAVAARPDHPGALLRLGTLRVTQGRNREAATLLSEAASRRPDAGEIQAALAVALLREGRRREALEHVDRAIALDGPSEELVAMRAQASAAAP